jgi:hypothetical protein
MLSDAQLAQSVIREVKNKKVPETLFKYRKFNEFTESIFRDNALYFSKPRDFNDPFDCKIVDAGNYSSAEIIDYLVGCGMPRPAAESEAIKNAADPNYIVSLIEKIKDEIFNKHCILCLSKCPDSILMWSYYSEAHTGFVLGFDLLADPLFFAYPIHPNYVPDYPAFKYLTEKDKILTHGMFSKSELWDHEEEIRIVKQSPSGPYKFSKKCLTQVVFGCRTEDANRNKLIKHLKDYGYDHVRLKRAVPSKVSYALEIQDLTLPYNL